MEIKRSELEKIKERFELVHDKLQIVKDTIVQDMSSIRDEIKQLETLIEADILATIKNEQKKHIDPKFCQHVNKKLDVHNNAETLVCTDCNLLLSFKQL